MDGNIAEFSPVPNHIRSSDSPRVERIVNGEDHDTTINSSNMSGGHVLQLAQDEGISLYLLHSCCRVGEPINHMVCWKDICRFSVLECCSQNYCDSGGRWTQ